MYVATLVNQNKNKFQDIDLDTQRIITKHRNLDKNGINLPNLHRSWEDEEMGQIGEENCIQMEVKTFYQHHNEITADLMLK